jgi:uncharacterized protein (TIGR03067 family)
MRAVFVVFVLAALVPDRQDPTPKETRSPQEQILGDWQDRNNKGFVFRIMASESVFVVNGKPSPVDGLTATYSVDWAKNPVAIDFVQRNGGSKLEAILKLEGDELMLALPLNNGMRPTQFEAGSVVLRYQRVRK